MYLMTISGNAIIDFNPENVFVQSEYLVDKLSEAVNWQVKNRFMIVSFYACKIYTYTG